MKTWRFTRIVAAIVVGVSIVACGALNFAQPTSTAVPTQTPPPTSTPIPTSTAVPLTPTPSPTTFPTVIINGVDPVKILESNGFTYSGGEELGSCTSSCAVYDNQSLGLSVKVYPDKMLLLSVDFDTALKRDTSAQAKLSMLLVSTIYGHDMMAWIAGKNEAVLAGSAQDGVVGNFSISMKLYPINSTDNYLVIAITPIN